MANDDWLKGGPFSASEKNPFDFSQPFGSFAPKPPSTNPFDNSINALAAPPYTPPGMLGVKPPGTLLGTAPSPGVANILARRQSMLRKVYFAFSFDDVFRVNNIRHQGKIGSRVSGNPRMFSDRSIWERRDIANEDNLKNLMRNAMRYSSVVCVAIGTKTWNSRWAKYEIARSVIDDKGLFAVHINGINHNITRAPDLLGVNPLHVIGIWRNEYGTFYLVEKHPVVVNTASAELGWQWRLYEDYKEALQKLPKYIPHLGVNEVAALSLFTAEYDMVRDGGFKNIGDWIDIAAAKVGR
jgi:hypothetical protein